MEGHKRLTQKGNKPIQPYRNTDKRTTMMATKQVTKEFKALQSFLKRRGITIKVNDLWSADIYGKRGRFDTERNRKYIAYDKEQCADILRWLKFYVGRSGKLTAEIKVEDEANENDMCISRYQETECEGTRYRYLYMKVQKGCYIHHARSFDAPILWLLIK